MRVGLYLQELKDGQFVNLQSVDDKFSLISYVSFVYDNPNYKVTQCSFGGAEGVEVSDNRTKGLVVTLRLVRQDV